MLCELDVLFLRPGRRGGIIKGGDVDNRILTLSDALCVPKKEQFEKLTVAHNLNDPFFCLLEDDSLISNWSIRTEQLLAIPLGMPDTYVRLIIDVSIKVTQINNGNMCFMGD